MPLQIGQQPADLPQCGRRLAAVSRRRPRNQQDELHKSGHHAECTAGTRRLLFGEHSCENPLRFTHLRLPKLHRGQQQRVGQRRRRLKKGNVSRQRPQLAQRQIQPFRQIEHIDNLQVLQIPVAVQSTGTNQIDIAAFQLCLPLFRHMHSASGANQHQLKKIMPVNHIDVQEIALGHHAEPVHDIAKHTAPRYREYRRMIVTHNAHCPDST